MAESMCPPEDGKKDWSFLDEQMKKENYQQYADEEGVSVEAYMFLFQKHTHDHDDVVLAGAAVVTMSDALEAIRIDRKNSKL